MAVQSLRDWRSNRHRERDVRTGSKAPTASKAATIVRGRRHDRTERRYGSRHNPISALIWLAGWAAALTLLAGIALTWGDANPANDLVHRVLTGARWLATPFEDVFTYRTPDKQLYATWGLAAAVYYVLGRVLSWLVRR